MSRKLPSIAPSAMFAIATTYQSIMTHLEDNSAKKNRYSKLFESLLEQILAAKSYDRSEAPAHGATDPRNDGIDMDWMHTSFKQSVLDASCAFDLASFDDLMFDYPYLDDPSHHVNW